MQVRSGGAARAATQSDFLAFFYFVAFLDCEFRKMQIKGQQALAMVDHYAIPLKEQVPRQDYSSGIHGCD